MTVLRSSEHFVFWYLYSLLDHFSCKAVAWLVHPTFCNEQIQMLWDLGLVNEDRLDLPADQWPRSRSDRDPQIRVLSLLRHKKIVILYCCRRETAQRTRI